MSVYDFCVIGRGLMGTACARWLAEAGHAVALVGPDEPEMPAQFDGPFGSFHDAARITRRVAHDRVWSDLSIASISRYRDIEARSGIGFFHETGALMAGRHTPGMTTFTKGLETCADQLGTQRLSPVEVIQRFGFHLPADSVTSYEPDRAGWLNPRRMRAAEEALAVAAGATVLAEPAVGLDGGTVTCASGATLSCGQVLCATGGYARTNDLLPARPKMKVYARTIAFAEVAGPIPEMPPLIWVPEDVEDDLYMLPPVLYPDGKYWIKIGGEIDSPLLETDAEMTAWFQSDGRPEAEAFLLDQLRRLLPETEWLSTRRAACAVSFTETGYPYIDRLFPTLTLLTGGNGAGAKCADELGRLGAELALGRSVEGFEAVFE